MSSSSQVVPITPDVLVRNEGTVVLFCPLTSQGQDWIDESSRRHRGLVPSASACVLACPSHFAFERIAPDN
jgi:hypothetical protein